MKTNKHKELKSYNKRKSNNLFKRRYSLVFEKSKNKEYKYNVLKK